MPWDYLDTGHVNPKTAFRPAPHSALSDVVSVHQDTGTPRDEPDQHTDHDEDDCDDHRTRLTTAKRVCVVIGVSGVVDQ